MSQWTHVAGMIRVDALRGIVPLGTPGNPNLKKLLGPMCTFDKWDDTSTIPRGSEGGLEYAINQGHEGGLAAYIVSIWGDLRSYDDVQEIHDWLTKAFDGLMIRNGVVEVEVEGVGQTVILYRDGAFTATFLALTPESTP